MQKDSSENLKYIWLIVIQSILLRIMITGRCQVFSKKLSRMSRILTGCNCVDYHTSTHMGRRNQNETVYGFRQPAPQAC